jgi:hypothetical protein
MTGTNENAQVPLARRETKPDLLEDLRLPLPQLDVEDELRERRRVVVRLGEESDEVGANVAHAPPGIAAPTALPSANVRVCPASSGVVTATSSRTCPLSCPVKMPR